MNFLILHGPNRNLMGLRSSRAGERVTLDKIDRALKRKANALGITLKTLQTHDSGKAITFIQRNRNWAQGLVISPGPWARFQVALLDALAVTEIPFAEIFFTGDYDNVGYSRDSLFKDLAIESVTDRPVEAYLTGLTRLHERLSKRQKASPGTNQ